MLSGIAALAAAPGVSVAAERADPCADIRALVAAYDAADADADRLGAADWEITQAYWKKFGRRRSLPTCCGVSYDIGLGREDVIAGVTEQYSRRLTDISRTPAADEALEDEVRASLKQLMEVDLAAINRVFDRVEQEIEDFGLGPARRAFAEAKERRSELLDRICDFRCTSIEQAAIKARALMSFHELDVLSEERVDDVLKSFLPI